MRLKDNPPGHLYDVNCIDISLGGDVGSFSALNTTDDLISCCRSWDLKEHGPDAKQSDEGRQACIALDNKRSGEVYVRDGESLASRLAHTDRWATALAATTLRP